MNPETPEAQNLSRDAQRAYYQRMVTDAERHPRDQLVAGIIVGAFLVGIVLIVLSAVGR